MIDLGARDTHINAEFSAESEYDVKNQIWRRMGRVFCDFRHGGPSLGLVFWNSWPGETTSQNPAAHLFQKREDRFWEKVKTRFLKTWRHVLKKSEDSKNEENCKM